MSVNVPLSPVASGRPSIYNPHSTILRRSNAAQAAVSQCRSVYVHRRRPSFVQNSRRQSIAAMSSLNTSQLPPPTPIKTNCFKRKISHTGKRRFFKGLEGRIHSRTPSPKKKRKIEQTTSRLSVPRPRSASDSTPNRCPSPEFFHNLGIVGNGSFAQVFKVKNAYAKKIFALKKSQNFLRSRESVNEALNEVQIMQLLQQPNVNQMSVPIMCHPKEQMDEKDEESVEISDDNVESLNKHVVRFYDFWISHKRQLHQLYEYYEHGTLADLLENNDRLNYLQILQVLEQLCNGLAFVHSHNIIHIDLKPANIFVSSEHVFKIGDFGVSINCNVDPNQTPSSKRKPALNCSGDPIYIAPEMMGFDRTLAEDIDSKTDIFSLGIILLELLCDIKAPSQGRIFQNLRKDIIDFTVMAPSPIVKSKCTAQTGFAFLVKKKEKKIDVETMYEIDGKIKDLCKRMLRKQSEKRPSCVDILDEIRDMLNEQKYSEYFASCDDLQSLSLAPENVFKKEEKDLNISLNASQNVSVHASHCNTTSNSAKKKIDNEVKSKMDVFYQESPKCFDTLFCRPSPSPINGYNHNRFSFISPISMNGSINCSENGSGVKCNLSSIFDDVLSPMVEAKEEKESEDNNNSNHNVFTFLMNDDEKDRDDTSSDDDEEDEDGNIQPGKLTFEFL